MADRAEVAKAIETVLEQRKRRLVNKNAVRAFLSAWNDPFSALGQIFMGRADVIDAERQRIAQDTMLDLLCKIDDAMTVTLSELGQQELPRTIVQGLIEAQGKHVDDVTGLSIGHDATVEFAPGTHVRAQGENAGSVVGVRIGASGKL